MRTLALAAASLSCSLSWTIDRILPVLIRLLGLSLFHMTMDVGDKILKLGFEGNLLKVPCTELIIVNGILLIPLPL